MIELTVATRKSFLMTDIVYTLYNERRTMYTFLNSTLQFSVFLFELWYISQMDKNLSVVEIIKAIRDSNLSPEDVRLMMDALNASMARAQLIAKRSLIVGQRVSFKDNLGAVYEGIVSKILKKNVEVRVERGSSFVKWRVSPTLLKEI